MTATKRCNGCGEVKLLSEFHVQSSMSDGYRGTCKECRKADTAAYRKKYPERLRANKARFYEEHREEIAAWQSAYRAAHPEKIRARKRAYRETHKEKLRAKHRAYWEENKEDLVAYRHAWYLENCEHVKTRTTAYRREHRDEYNESRARWRQTPKGRVSIRTSKLNRRSQTGKPATSEAVEEVLAEYGNICPYCNQPIGEGNIDHIVPLSGGGTSERSNLVYCCARCNKSKGSKSLLEFVNYRLMQVSA